MPKRLKKELNRIFIFHHVASLNSFSAAAAKLDMSRSVVMQNIKDLEDSFNVRLFNRTTRSFSMTNDGKLLQIQAAKVLFELDLAYNQLRDHHRAISGTIKLQVPLLLDIPQLHQALSAYIQRNPKVNLDVVNGERVHDMQEKNLDLVLHVGELPPGDFYARKIMDFESYILASPDYLKKNGMPLHPSGLRDHICLNYRHCLTGNHWQFENPATGLTELHPITRTTTVDSERMLVSLCESGHGIASALGITCKTQVDAGKLIPILSAWTQKIPLYLVFASTQSMSRMVRDFLEAISDDLPRRLS